MNNKDQKRTEKQKTEKKIIITGVALDADKITYTALADIYGIGFANAKRMCNALSINYKQRLGALKVAEIKMIEEYIKENHIVGLELKRFVMERINSEIETGSFKGLRLKNKYPARGQRTSTNAQTAKKGIQY